jgi:hypothetical protein
MFLSLLNVSRRVNRTKVPKAVSRGKRQRIVAAQNLAETAGPGLARSVMDCGGPPPLSLRAITTPLLGRSIHLPEAFPRQHHHRATS